VSNWQKHWLKRIGSITFEAATFKEWMAMKIKTPWCAIANEFYSIGQNKSHNPFVPLNARRRLSNGTIVRNSR
jgi:hypothetical protein